MATKYIPTIAFTASLADLVYSKSPGVLKLVETSAVTADSVLTRAEQKLNRDILTKWWTSYTAFSKTRPSATKTNTDGKVVSNFNPANFQQDHPEVEEALRLLFLHYLFDSLKATPTGVKEQFSTLARQYREDYRELLFKELIEVSDIYDNDGDGVIEDGELSSAFERKVYGIRRSHS